MAFFYIHLKSIAVPLHYFLKITFFLVKNLVDSIS